MLQYSSIPLRPQTRTEEMADPMISISSSACKEAGDYTNSERAVQVQKCFENIKYSTNKTLITRELELASPNKEKNTKSFFSNSSLHVSFYTKSKYIEHNIQILFSIYGYLLL